jgi:hypothetical protein
MSPPNVLDVAAERERILRRFRPDARQSRTEIEIAETNAALHLRSGSSFGCLRHHRHRSCCSGASGYANKLTSS